MRANENIIDILRSAGLRPTRQRIALGRVLFEGGDKHVSAEALYAAAKEDGVRVSLATVYNTLHQFQEAGLLREVVVEPGRSYFDTNMHSHHHFFDETNGELADIDEADVRVEYVPAAPAGKKVARVDVVMRLTSE